MAVLTAPKTVTIRLGDQEFEAKKITLAKLNELNGLYSEGKITDSDFTFKVLYEALKPCNPDITLENLQENLTVEVAATLEDVLGELGMKIPEKKKEEIQLTN